MITVTNPFEVPQPPRPQRPWKTILIVLGVVLVLCCGGAIFGGYRLFKGVQGATEPARTAAETFVTDLEHGDVDAAYGLLCKATKAKYTLETFRDGVSKQPKISSHAFGGVNVMNYNGKVSATVVLVLTFDTSFTERHTFPLVKEDDQWLVCGQPY
ncbi:hypothetical protein GCM10010532_103760 [Dactylosporangium siamense]|uniref:DUF4878 domain-containing protein n=1 Tax=Dactylosporangium siamense TaxID=685454 RepID=A0A919UGN6_9ACTN|nr:hypothetical protein Dsi01nite_095470 [Dactylosporangium siamense]